MPDHAPSSFGLRARSLSLSALAVAFALALASTASADASKGVAKGGKPAAPAQRALSQTLTGQAKADYEAGKLLYGDGDFAGALIKLQNAYDASKDPRLLYNIATCQKAERHYARTIATLRRYLIEDSSLSAADAKSVQETISVLEPFTTKLTFKVSEDGARVQVDDDVVGSTPLTAPAVVDIGERHLRVTKDGCVPFEKTLPVGGSANISVEVNLEKEVHEGHLLVNVPSNATVTMDDKPLGVGKIDQKIPAGGHQLRVTAPGMRPFQSEIVLQDKETRSLDVTLEAEAPPELPRIRVAVGCGDSEPRGTDDGLVAYLDGPEVLQPTDVKKRWDADLARNVVQYVEYKAAAGTHAIRLRVEGCTSLEQSIVVDPRDGADVVGALELDRFTLFRGAQGTPGWWKLGLSLWLPAVGTNGGGENGSGLPDSYSANFGDLVGGKLSFAFVRRWIEADFSAAVAKGSFKRTTFESNYALPDSASSTSTRYGFRFGPRLPLRYVSISLGPSIALDTFNIDQVRTGKSEVEIGGYFELDIQPVCDVGFFLLGTGGGLTIDGGVGAFDFGMFLEPSTACKNERDTPFGLRAKGGAQGDKK